jgi:hypothetical protein
LFGDYLLASQLAELYQAAVVVFERFSKAY